MDCRTAQLLIEFVRPAVAELDAADAQELHGHLAACPECASASHLREQMDHHFGAAMRAVPLPIGLRDWLLARLAALPRTRRHHILRWATGAAVCRYPPCCGIAGSKHLPTATAQIGNGRCLV